jgi:hypothetical protein
MITRDYRALTSLVSVNILSNIVIKAFLVVFTGDYSGSFSLL